MIADHLGRTVSKLEINGGARVEVFQRANGTCYVMLMLRRARVQLDPNGPLPRTRWREEYGFNSPDLKTAKASAELVARRYIERACVVCGHELVDSDTDPYCCCVFEEEKTR